MAAPGFGFSPTDIVNGVVVGRKAFKAVRDGDDGARHQYQDTKRAIAHRIRALEDLTVSATDALSDINEQYGPLVESDRAFQQSLGSYEQGLGRGAPQGSRHGIRKKLKYAFQGGQSVQAYLDSSRPAVDAALFRTLQ